jgi:hypothetical protein
MYASGLPPSYYPSVPHATDHFCVSHNVPHPQPPQKLAGSHRFQPLLPLNFQFDLRMPWRVVSTFGGLHALTQQPPLAFGYDRGSSNYHGLTVVQNHPGSDVLLHLPPPVPGRESEVSSGGGGAGVGEGVVR